MRAGASWLLVGGLTGLAVVGGGIAHAAHAAPDDPYGLAAPAGAFPEAHRTAETWIAAEVVQMNHALGARVQGLEETAAWLIRATEAEAKEVRQACVAVESALTALGRCFEAGVAASPFGPAGPRAAGPPPGADGGSDPCRVAGRGA
jgi:hypothetical protein